MKSLLAVLTAVAALMVVTSVPVAAQAPPMDMSWGINAQMRYQAMGDAYARNMAQYYYNYMQMLRAQGYTGPSLPTGFDANTLMQSNAAANAAAGRLIQSGMINSDRRSNASGDWSNRAIRGCQVWVDAYGNRYYGCP